MAKDNMRNGIGWYGFIGVITTSTTDKSLMGSVKLEDELVQVTEFQSLWKAYCFVLPLLQILGGTLKVYLKSD